MLCGHSAWLRHYEMIVSGSISANIDCHFWSFNFSAGYVTIKKRREEEAEDDDHICCWPPSLQSAAPSGLYSSAHRVRGHQLRFVWHVKRHEWKKKILSSPCFSSSFSSTLLNQSHSGWMHLHMEVIKTNCNIFHLIRCCAIEFIKRW